MLETAQHIIVLSQFPTNSCERYAKESQRLNICYFGEIQTCTFSSPGSVMRAKFNLKWVNENNIPYSGKAVEVNGHEGTMKAGC